MKPRNSIFLIVLLLVSVIGYSGTAHAWAFYWSKVEVQTASWQSCMSFAYEAAQRYQLTEVKRTNLAITGNRNGASASVTCIGTGAGSKAIAVVMVVGDSDGPVRQLRDDLAGYIHQVVNID